MEPYRVRVLLAEDDERVARATERLLRQVGFAVVGVARDGDQAVRLCATTQPDVVLMDLQMPELDGLEASRRIRAHSNLPIVALTGVTTDAMGAEAARAGIDAFLVKPIRAHEMVSSISHVLERHAMAHREASGGQPTGEPGRSVECAGASEGDGEPPGCEEGTGTLVPICAQCKRVRVTAAGDWLPIEGYLASRHGVQVTHGLCPHCVRERYADFAV